MLDKLTGSLLKAVSAQCSEGGFKVMDEEELLGLLPKGAIDREGVRRMLFYLRDHDFLDVQYAEEGLYCVRPLPEGRLYFERIRETRREGVRKRVLSALVTAGSALLGGFLGALLAALLL